LERENGFLRELVATSEQRSKHFEGVQHELENIKIQHKNELQQCFGREKDLENKLFNLEHEHKQMAQYAEACNERITMLESSFNNLPSDKDTMHSYKSSDFQVDPDNYSNLVDKLEEYEQMIFDLENQRNESLTEVEQMKSRIQNFSENMKSSKTNTKSNSSHNNELEDKVKKAIKEAKKLKDQLFKQKKDYETKHNNFKRRHKLDIEGYKQESQLKEKDIERQKKEIEKLRRKVGRNEIDSSQIVKAVVKHNFNSKKPSVNIVNSARKANNI
jgi:chromosome segregation ATPase